MKELPPYWTDPYKAHFEITILDVRETKRVTEITIKEPVVRSAGGGQAGDRGILHTEERDIQFLGTRKHGENTVLIADRAPLTGQKHNLAIDWEWRYGMMKNHTAEHLLVAQLLKMHPDILVSELWIDGENGSIVLDEADFEIKDLLIAENEVQKLIERSIPISTDLVESQAVDDEVRVRKGALERHDELRVVRIGEHDQSACSGTHVKNTEEIRAFKIVDYQISEGSAHVEFVTAAKAISILSRSYNAALRRKHTVPFEMEQLGHILDKYCALQFNHQRMTEKIKSVVPDVVETVTSGETSILHDVLPGFDTKALRDAALNLNPAKPALIILFSPGDTSHVVVRSVGLEREAKFYVEGIVESLGGKGGGGGDIYTGGFSSAADPDSVYDNLVSKAIKTMRKSVN